MRKKYDTGPGLVSDQVGDWYAQNMRAEGGEFFWKVNPSVRPPVELAETLVGFWDFGYRNNELRHVADRFVAELRDDMFTAWADKMVKDPAKIKYAIRNCPSAFARLNVRQRKKVVSAPNSMIQELVASSPVFTRRERLRALLLQNPSGKPLVGSVPDLGVEGLMTVGDRRLVSRLLREPLLSPTKFTKKRFVTQPGWVYPVLEELAPFSREETARLAGSYQTTGVLPKLLTRYVPAMPDPGSLLLVCLVMSSRLCALLSAEDQGIDNPIVVGATQSLRDTLLKNEFGQYQSLYHQSVYPKGHLYEQIAKAEWRIAEARRSAPVPQERPSGTVWEQLAEALLTMPTQLKDQREWDKLVWRHKLLPLARESRPPRLVLHWLGDQGRADRTVRDLREWLPSVECPVSVVTEVRDWLTSAVLQACVRFNSRSGRPVPQDWGRSEEAANLRKVWPGSCDTFPPIRDLVDLIDSYLDVPFCDWFSETLVEHLNCQEEGTCGHRQLRVVTRASKVSKLVGLLLTSGTPFTRFVDVLPAQKLMLAAPTETLRWLQERGALHAAEMIPVSPDVTLPELVGVSAC